jgi:uncharacterized protein DUF5753
MTHADYRAELDAFVAELNRARRAAGNPAFAHLMQLATQLHNQERPGGARFVPLPPSTTSEILSGQRKALKWPWVLTFLTALREAAGQGGIDAAEVGSIEQWKRKHEALLAAQEAQSRPAQAAGRRPHGAQGRVGANDRGPGAGTAIATVREDESPANALLGAYLAVSRGVVPQGRHGGRDIVPEWLEMYLNLESHGGLIRTYETALIPGLLQTEAYARAVIGQELPAATPDEIARLVDQRMQRQLVRGQQKPYRLWAVVEEAAVHGRQVDARIMRAQIEHLIDLTDKPGLVLQIMPTGAADNLTLSEPMAIFSLPEPISGDVVFLEQLDPALFLYQRKDTNQYKRVFDGLSLMASRPSDAKQVLTTILGGM